MNAPEPILQPASAEQLPLGNAFGTLPPAFFTRLQPTPMPSPYLVGASASAAASIGLDPGDFQRQDTVEAFAGNRILPGSEPLAAVYSGHQFGVWAGQLGDGRAILLGDVPARAPSPTGRTELQLKGAGLTPYSRMGDGRAVLRSSIREFLCSEAMHALGIPTSRALCVVGSDMLVMRETPETAAVATRMAPSFVRFGSFEHWFYNERQDELRLLADHVIERFYPELRASDNPVEALLREVTRRTAELMAQWQAVGFMHGVMNTDNMSILGLTIDYGPFGFMEAFDARHICNHSDHQGRYAYHMQPKIGQWNCFALGQALLPLIGDVDTTQAALANYGEVYQERFDALLHAKLGLASVEEDDGKLIDALFALLQANHPDYTLFFRRLGELRLDDPGADEPLRDMFIDRPAFDAWAGQYRERLRREASEDGSRRARMHAVNPKYVLRNYLAQVAIEKAQDKDFSEVARLLSVLEKPFDEQPENEHYANLPPDWASSLEVSCSS
ncbi:protein adenylyltransferase SelO [Noviherbaspirillum galbum]|uniref:Protein nucleotidyltransferase YdiU n=1 Tax=Noviherbaspirillum galbum TaxID=2709383 RepID=A0A6B3SQS4_9BURK|nr:YdiU family protein [Noviherbaspirillum galbum]NEX62868.1 YdiU family protein [Noviherbaspirillum galbum]